MKYPEIKKLESLQQQHHLKVGLISSTGPLLEVVLISKDQRWHLFIEDEYGDFDEQRQLLCIFLVLRSLEDYKDEADFLAWCNLVGLNPSEDKWLDYYRGLAVTYREIASILGELDSCINSLDYQLRSGAFSALLEMES